MKRLIMLLLLLAISAGLCSAAAGAPVITDGDFSAWIGPENILCVQNGEQIIIRQDILADDLLSVNEECLYLLDHSGQVLSISRDGASTSVFLNKPTEEELEAVEDKRFTLNEGKLTTAAGTELSDDAAAAACDGTYLYWVEKERDLWMLRQQRITAAEGTASDPLPLNRQRIPETISLCVTREGLVMTAADHSVNRFDLSDGRCTSFQPAGDRTAAAAIADGKLLRYALTETGTWITEKEETDVPGGDQPEASSDPSVTATPVPTATPTPVPTYTPTPSPRPTAAPTVDDGRISLGDTGSLVRKMQQRLSDLGYPVGKVDGVYGKGTQQAVNLFQNAIRVRECNYMTRDMQRRLFAADAPVYDRYMELMQGDSGTAVRIMQERLQELGYDPGKADGIYGRKTVQAVALFLVDAEIPVSTTEVPGSRASRKTLQVMYGNDAPHHSVDHNGGRYRLSASTAVFLGTVDKNAGSLNIQSVIHIEGKAYRVTSIARNACKGMTRLKSVTIGENISKIGNAAFSGCTNLKNITVNTRSLKDDNLGTDIFNGVPEKAVVFCPADLAKTYRKLFRARGLPKAVTFNPEITESTIAD